MIVEMEIEVRSTELDALGHVNQAKYVEYVEYLEWGRFDWLRANGLPHKPADAGSVGSVIANVNVNFRREARLGERLTVRTWLAAVGRSSFRFAQDIRNAAGEVVCDAVSTAVTFDLRARASVAIPDELRKRLVPLVKGDRA